MPRRNAAPPSARRGRRTVGLVALLMLAATSDRLLFVAENDRYGAEPWSGPLEP
jgi:hypothetical protein